MDASAGIGPHAYARLPGTWGRTTIYINVLNRIQLAPKHAGLKAQGVKNHGLRFDRRCMLFGLVQRKRRIFRRFR